MKYFLGIAIGIFAACLTSSVAMAVVFCLAMTHFKQPDTSFFRSWFLWYPLECQTNPINFTILVQSTYSNFMFFKDGDAHVFASAHDLQRLLHQ